MKLIEFFSKLSIICAVALVLSRPVFAKSDKQALFEKIDDTVYNFREVTPNLYRSGLVSEESVPYLKELGIKTIITFDNKLWRVAKEQAFLEGTGIKSISIPWSGFSYPDEETILRIHEMIDNPELQPVLVHCKHGQERTGVVIATWRIARQNWNTDQAYKEMRACGFRTFQYGHLKKYVYEFAKKHGDENAKIGIVERIKTNVFSFFYHFRKLNPF